MPGALEAPANRPVRERRPAGRVPNVSPLSRTFRNGPGEIDIKATTAYDRGVLGECALIVLWGPAVAEAGKKYTP